MDATQKFDRGRSNSAAKERGRKKKGKQKEENWKGSDDVEKLSAIFTNYLTSVNSERKKERRMQKEANDSTMNLKLETDAKEKEIAVNISAADENPGN